MMLPLTKAIDASRLTQALKRVVPTVNGIGASADGTSLTISRLGGGDFTPAELALLQQGLAAHDVAAETQAQQARKDTLAALRTQLTTDESQWDSLTPTQHLAVMRRLLRLLLLERG